MTTGPGATGGPGPPTARRALDASMGLLNDVTSKALDPGYAEAAARAPAPRTRAKLASRTALHLVLAVVLGVVTVVAVSELRAPAAGAESPRALLEREITARSTVADELAGSVETLRAEIAQIQADAIASLNPGLFSQLEEYELASGALAVSGPGLVVELDDGDPAEHEDDSWRVQDVDLQIVTNGLWAAGAEAIAVNGQRLTALSAIRGAGQAILVDLAPLIAPYRIEVIGDGPQMQTAFARSSAANHLAFLSWTYGITATTTAQTLIELPGSGITSLRHADPMENVTVSSSSERSGPPEEKSSP